MMSVTKASNHASKKEKEKAKAAIRNARWRESYAKKLNDLMDELNAKRALLNLPEVTLTLPKASLKGTKKPEYSPPTTLSPNDLKKWKANERKKRKAVSQRENRKRKAELIKSFKAQLVDLDKQIEDQKKKKKVSEKAAKPAEVEAIDRSISVPMNGDLKPPADDVQIAWVTAEEEDELMNSSFANSFDVDLASWDDGVRTLPNETDVVPKVIFHTQDSTPHDVDDSSWADNSDSFDEDFDVPIDDIFNEKDAIFESKYLRA